MGAGRRRGQWVGSIWGAVNLKKPWAVWLRTVPLDVLVVQLKRDLDIGQGVEGGVVDKLAAFRVFHAVCCYSDELRARTSSRANLEKSKAASSGIPME